MGKCRITHIQSPCGYRPEGITDIRLLDFEDFKGFGFKAGENYDGCFVAGIVHTGEFIPVETPDSAKYSSYLQNGIHTHTIETFIGDLAADTQAQLQLAGKRRHVVTFRNRSDKRFVFGGDSGAILVFNNQTAGGAGALVTIAATSIYPLFEVSDTYIAWGGYINDWEWVEPDKECIWGDYINAWGFDPGCRNDFSWNFNNDFTCVDLPYVDVSPDSLSFPASPVAGQTVSVESNINWVLDMAKPAWVTVSPTSSEGNGTVTVSASAYTGRNSRSGTLSYSLPGVPDFAPITQSVSQVPKAEYVTIGSTSVSKDGGSVTLTGMTNSSRLTFSLGSGSIPISLPGSYLAGGVSTANGAAISGDPGASAEFSFSITVSIPANGTIDARTGVITVTNESGQTSSGTISQAAGDSTLIISPPSLTLVADGTAQSVTVTSNTNWSVE